MNTLRERVAQTLYHEDGVRTDWDRLPEDRRLPWLKDADRAIQIIQPDYSAVTAERDRAQQACEVLAPSPTKDQLMSMHDRTMQMLRDA